MKFMKLGSKPDAFQADGGAGDSRYVLSDLPSDIVVHVDDASFYLHKFPLLSKSSLLQRLIVEASQGGADEVHLRGLPGGARAFEVCAKFCYGMVVTLNPYNVVAARCAAEHLGMTEDVDKSNLVFKIEVFLNSGVFRSWKDSIIALQSTVALLPWSEELRLVARCVDSIAAKATASPGSVVWSYTYNRKAASSDEIVEARRFSSSAPAVPRDWWVEDLCELDVELYKRVMVAVKSRGDGVPPDVVGEALRAYAARWLPGSCRRGDTPADDDDACAMEVLETIVWLLPSDGGGSSPCGCSCQFLLNLLKLAVLVGAGELLREELMDRIALQLHEASVSDLLIPAKPPAQTAYDVDLVETLVGRYMRRAGADDVDTEEDAFETGVEAEDSSLLALCKIVDGYLAEVAADPDLPVSSFVGLASSMPESARPSHDAMYTAIDVFLKEHPNLGKVEKRRISGLMDVKKLSKEASIHAAQNDRLPLRVVVQVLFFEQMRAAAAGSASTALLLADGSARLELEEEDDEDCWKNRALALALPEPPTASAALRKQIGSMSLKLVGEDRRRAEDGGGGEGRRLARSASIANQSSRMSLSSRSRRIFDRLWVVGKPPGPGEVVSKSSDTSGSSQSPRSSGKPLGSSNKSSGGSSSRNRRYSVS